MFEGAKRLFINDYVICKERSYMGYNNRESKYFIENNIGKLIIVDKSDENPYCVEYYNVPTELQSDFYYSELPDKYVRWMERDEIIYHSKYKESLEEILSIKKYNL
jgi:hypothetical protein